MTYEKQLSNTVQTAIGNSGLSEKFIAEKTLIPRTTLRRRIREGTLTVSDLNKIAIVLGLETDELLPAVTNQGGDSEQVA